jgi:hypothetical protein
MTQIVRKFILLSIILVIVLSTFLYFFNQKKENFSIRDINGRRGKYMRKCIGSSNNGLNSNRQKCITEAFQNKDITTQVAENVDVSNISVDNVMSHIINQIPNWSKNNSNIEDILDDPPIEIQYKKINLDTFHLKFKNPLNLSKYEKDFKKVLENDISKLSMMYNNMNKQEKKNFKKLLLKNGFIALKLHVNEVQTFILPRQDFLKKNITLRPDDNDQLLIHINTNTEKSKKGNYKLHNISIERINDEVDLKFSDISMDIGLFNLGDKSEFIKFKNVKVINK